MMRKTILGFWVCVVGMSVQAQPQSSSGDPVAGCTALPCPPVTGDAPALLQVGQATRALLQRQAAGAEASPSPHALPGVVAQKIYTRYVESFAHPIPERAASPMALNASKK